MHGVDPQTLVQKILRERIYASAFWQEHLLNFPLEACLDKLSVHYVGGAYANQRPCPFLCVLLKLLQQGAQGVDWVDGHLMQKGKYAAALGLMLARLTEQDAVKLYTFLERHLIDRRRLKFKKMDGTFAIKYMDEFVEELLGYREGSEARCCDVLLPRLASRFKLESEGRLAPREALASEQQAAPGAQSDEGQAVASRRKREKWRL